MILKKVNVKSNAGNLTTTDYVTSEDFLWIPSVREVDGVQNYSEIIKGESSGTFSIFTNDSSRFRERMFGSGLANNWMLRSPFPEEDFSFYKVSVKGNIWHDFPIYAYGVCFGFCI